MNAVALRSFTQYIKQLLGEMSSRKCSSEFAKVLITHKQTLFISYGDEYIRYTASYLLKNLTDGKKKIGDDDQMTLPGIEVPDYFTVTDEDGKVIRIESKHGTLKHWEKNNQFIKHHADKSMAEFDNQERSRMFCLGIAGGDDSWTIEEVISTLRQKN